MKPDAAENSEFLPEMDKGVKVVTDEVVNGEYGLVINGHSLVHTYIQFQFMCMLSLSNFKRCAYFVTGELLPYANAVLSFLIFYWVWKMCLFDETSSSGSPIK